MNPKPCIIPTLYHELRYIIGYIILGYILVRGNTQREE